MIHKIILVAGHGKKGRRNDPGAIAIDGTTERQIAVSIVKKIESKFYKNNIITIGTRTSMTLAEKTKSVNDLCHEHGYTRETSVLISIHCDFRGASEGVSGYYDRRYSESDSLLTNILVPLSESTGRKLKWKKSDNKSRFGRLGIIRDTIPLACLVEVGTLRSDNNEDDGLELLKSDNGQELIAQAIADGITAHTEIRQKSNKVSNFAIPSVEKAIKENIATDWSDPQKIVASSEVEWMLKKLGIFREVSGKGVSKERFVVFLDRVGLLR